MSRHPIFGPDGPSPATGTGQTSTTPRPGTSAAVSNDELLRFVDGALDDTGRVRVLTHLAAHPAAVGRVEAYLHQNARLRALREHLPLTDSRDFAAPLQAAIVARLTRHRRHHGWRRAAVAAAVAAVVLGGAAGLALPHFGAGSKSSPSDAATASMQAYFLFGGPDAGALIEPVAEAEGASAIDLAAFAWLAERSADVAITPPDLDQLGLQLVDGNVLDQQGSPAIRTVYQDAAGKPVVLFAGIGKPDVRHAFWLEREGYVSLQWRRGPMIFALVAPTDSPQLSAMVELVGAAVARVPLPDASATSGTPPAAEPQPVATDTVAPAAESSPVQSIAAPLAPPAQPAPAPVVEPDSDTIHPDDLLKNAESNKPEPL